MIGLRRVADRSYLDARVTILELAEKAHRRSLKQPPHEKRRLLDFLVSNAIWKNGELSATFRKPFDLLMDTNLSYGRDVAVMETKKVRNKKWPTFVDTYRTLLFAPNPELTSLFERVEDLIKAA